MTKETKLKKGKIGILLWIFSCLFGSLIVTGIEGYFTNQINVFHLSVPECILLSLFMTLVTIIGSSPVILSIYFLSKKFNHLTKLITLSLTLAFVITFSISFSLSRSLFEAFYLTTPYFFFAFIFGFYYSRIEK
jgi:hypothetical protein